MVTVGVNENGEITIAGKSTEKIKNSMVEPVVAIKIGSIEEASELVTTLLYAIRNQAYDKGYTACLKYLGAYEDEKQ